MDLDDSVATFAPVGYQTVLHQSHYEFLITAGEVRLSISSGRSFPEFLCHLQRYHAHPPRSRVVTRFPGLTRI